VEFKNYPVGISTGEARDPQENGGGFLSISQSILRTHVPLDPRSGSGEMRSERGDLAMRSIPVNGLLSSRIDFPEEVQDALGRAKK
jgi:hypothetical protein